MLIPRRHGDEPGGRPAFHPGFGLLSLVPMALVTGLVAHRLGGSAQVGPGEGRGDRGGDFRELDGPGRGDEVDDLVGSVNRMADQLREMVETIRRTERAGVLAQLAAGLGPSAPERRDGARMAVQLHARRCPIPDRGQPRRRPAATYRSARSRSRGCFRRPGSARPSGFDRPRRSGEEVVSLVEPTCRHVGVELDPGDSIRPISIWWTAIGSERRS